VEKEANEEAQAKKKKVESKIQVSIIRCTPHARSTGHGANAKVIGSAR
jgi:hypothetical protein